MLHSVSLKSQGWHTPGEVTFDISKSKCLRSKLKNIKSGCFSHRFKRVISRERRTKILKYIEQIVLAVASWKCKQIVGAGLAVFPESWEGGGLRGGLSPYRSGPSTPLQGCHDIWQKNNRTENVKQIQRLRLFLHSPWSRLIISRRCPYHIVCQVFSSEQ